MTNESIVHSMNDLISAVEMLCLGSKRELMLVTGRYPEYAVRMKNNDLKRALGQLKAARASLLTADGPHSFEEINQMTPDQFKSRDSFVQHYCEGDNK